MHDETLNEKQIKLLNLVSKFNPQFVLYLYKNEI